MEQETEIQLIPAGLTEKQWKFVNAYVKSFSATKAARSIGTYKDDQSASNGGWRFLHVPAVREAISELLAERNALWAQEHWRIIQEALTIGLSNIGDFVSCNGQDVTFTDWDEIPHHKLAAVQAMTKRTFKNGTVELELKMQPKARGVELLMKNLGMLNGKSEQKTNRGEFARWSESLRNPSDETLKTEALEDEVRQLKAELEKAKGQSDGKDSGGAGNDVGAGGDGDNGAA